MGNRELSAVAGHGHAGNQWIVGLGHRFQQACASLARRTGRHIVAVPIALVMAFGLKVVPDARAAGGYPPQYYTAGSMPYMATSEAAACMAGAVYFGAAGWTGAPYGSTGTAQCQYRDTWNLPHTGEYVFYKCADGTTGGPYQEGTDRTACSTPPPPPPTCPSNGQTAGDHLACIKQLTYERASCPIENPIYPGRGNKAQSEIRYAATSATDLSLVDTYRSDWAIAPQAGLGSRWTHNWARALDIAAAGNAEPVIVAMRADGSPISFYKDTTTGAWTVTQNISADRLEALAPGDPSGARWRYTDAATDAQELYDSQGRLLSVRERNGWATTLSYSTASTPANLAPRAGLLLQVRNPFGRVLTFAYDASSRVSTVSGSSGLIATYSYTILSLPDRVTWADGKNRQYHYEDPAVPGGLTGITDEAGVRFSTYTYDSQGRATSSEHAGGVGKVLLQFLAGSQTTVTTADGSSRTITFQSQGNVIHPTSVSAPCPECGNAAKSTAYDGSGNASSRVDFDNKETRYSYDALGRETQRIEGYGTADAKTTTTEWHPTWSLPLKVAAPGRVEYFSYDAKGQIVGFAWFPTNDSSGSQGTTAAPSGVVTSTGWTYDANGLVTATVEMAGDVVTGQWTYTYDDAGKLQTLTNGASNIGRIVQYDAAGRVLEAINTDGQRIRYQYDARGNPILYEKDGVAVTFEYDAAGFLTATKGPGDYYLGYQYDAAHRVIGMLVPSETVSPAGSTARSSASASAKNDESAAGTLEQFWSWLKVWLTSWISEARAQAASVLVPVTGASSDLQPPMRSTRMPADDLEEAAGQRQAPRVGILSIILPDGSRWSSSSSGQSGCDNECAALQAKISELVTDLRLRYLNLTIDKLSLFCVNPIGKFSWVGHLEKYGNKQRELAKAIARAKAKGCSYRSDADYFASLPPPACPVQ